MVPLPAIERIAALGTLTTSELLAKVRHTKRLTLMLSYGHFGNDGEASRIIGRKAHETLSECETLLEAKRREASGKALI
jgi:hypothetical protein